MFKDKFKDKVQRSGLSIRFKVKFKFIDIFDV
jgi:hypothetical protein